MYGEKGKQSDTISLNDRPADVSSLMAQAMTAMKAGSAEPAKASPVPQIEAAVTKKAPVEDLKDEDDQEIPYELDTKP